MLWACVPSRAHTCCLLFFLYLFVRETQFYLFFSRGGVVVPARNADLFFIFNSVFAVFSCFRSPSFCFFMPVMRFLQRISSVEELQKCLHGQKNPSIPAQCRQLECRRARAGNALLHGFRASAEQEIKCVRACTCARECVGN